MVNSDPKFKFTIIILDYLKADKVVKNVNSILEQNTSFVSLDTK